ncbi:Uma2 family endonuclease [Arhodomonas sp. SL1]|uniref:Uma2 family endonuclease n=1 Tax=Arhodomonas sp. SL1 TaxID=3425691 RepID=UPI003F8806FB
MSDVARELPRRHRYTVGELHRMAAAGVFGGDDRVELIQGEIIDMAPIGSRHAGTVAQFSELLRRTLGERGLVWVQSPLALGEYSAPQPDIAVLAPRADFYKEHLPGPAEVCLVIEVADTTVAYDRDTKLPLYADHGIPEAWLVDLEGGQLLRRRAGGEDCESVADLESVVLPTPPGGRVDLSDVFATP